MWQVYKEKKEIGIEDKTNIVNLGVTYKSSSKILILCMYVCMYVWLDILASRSWDRNPVDSNANPRLYPSATRNQQQRSKFYTVMNHNYYCLHTSA